MKRTLSPFLAALSLSFAMAAAVAAPEARADAGHLSQGLPNSLETVPALTPENYKAEFLDYKGAEICLIFYSSAACRGGSHVYELGENAAYARTMINSKMLKVDLDAFANPHHAVKKLAMRLQAVKPLPAIAFIGSEGDALTCQVWREADGKFNEKFVELGRLDGPPPVAALR